MFTFYDMEVFKHDWLAVFINDQGEITKFHNDRGALERFLSTINLLVGYNNYAYDDKIITAILKGLNPYDVSQKIINNKPFKLRLQNPLTLDVMQELKGVSLKEAQANLGQNIIETPIDFNINRQLSQSEINNVFKYCINDVRVTKELFENRESYFASKFEIVKEFNLKANSVKRTRANLAAEVLNAKPSSDNNRLKLTYDKRLSLKELPEQVLNFYDNIQHEYEQGTDYTELEKRKITYNLAGTEHQYGFGGLHGAKENYKGEGKFMQIDISSYYPSLIINNNFINSIDKFKQIYDVRMELKAENDDKQSVYKIILNATYGSLKNKYSKLYNPQMANNIVVNGQLILTHLICLLEPFCELIQTNTDGLIIKYENHMKDSIKRIIDLFSEQYELKFDIDYITKIAQRDVNNYVLKYDDGSYKAKGRFANYESGNFERNSLTIIDKALVDYYMKGKRVNKTVIDAWKNNKLERFQYVTKAGKFDGMAQELKSDTLFGDKQTDGFVELQKVNRIFAGKDKNKGAVYKMRNDKETRYSKVPYTSENSLVWNDAISKLDKRKINLNWYIKEVEGWLF